MAGRADVLIENYKAGTLAGYGLGPADLSAIHPRLVYCSLTGYGQTGPLAERPGYDTLFQAQSGMMSLTGLPDGSPDGGPLRVGFALVDVMAAHQAVMAIQAALWERERSGLGQHIDLALLDCAMAALSHVAQGHLLGSPQPPRMGNGAVGAGPSEVLRCRDGRIYVTAPSNALFGRLCTAIGRPELVDIPRFATPRLRAEARAELLAILDDYCATRERAEVCERLAAAGVPAGMVNDLAQAFADPQAAHRQAVVGVPHALHDDLQLLASPLRLARTPPRHALPPPLLGQHTDELLAEWLALDGGQIARLRSDGIVA
jgi:crotonobetainyl-CoA:carnitine CoA-transferase CaiB-like acyl-CoA transferase